MSAGRNVAGDEGVGEGVNEGVGRNEARVFRSGASMIKTERKGRNVGSWKTLGNLLDFSRK
jgi:hypothetical protein